MGDGEQHDAREKAAVAEVLEESDEEHPPPRWRHLDVGSPFDYGRQSQLWVARDLPDPGRMGVSWAKAVDELLVELVQAAGGRTLAVTATGLETVYPPENEGLAAEVAASGAILTEFRLDQKPLAGLFPQRNRVISGLSLAVILVEASRKSGALHTARHATEQNRDVFAVPGRIDSAASDGCCSLSWSR